jgi:hypothetical protein
MSDHISISSHGDVGRSRGIHRRQFIALVSASVAAPCLLGLPRALQAASSDPGNPVLVPLSLGYLTGSDALVADAGVLRRLNDPRESVLDVMRAALPEGSTLEVNPVTKFSQDLGDFPTGQATLWVHGMFPPARVRSDYDIEAVAFDVDFFPTGESEPYTYHAWRFVTEPVVNESGPVGVTVPVGGGASFRLRVSVTRLSGGFSKLVKRAYDVVANGAAALTPPSGERFAAQYHDPGKADQLSLAPGIYLVPLGEEANAGLPFTVRSEYLVPAERPYLVFSMVPQKD